MAKSYILRGIPQPLWSGAKARAETEGATLKSVILELLRYYVQQGLPPYGS
jgi:hypothetical protein